METTRFLALWLAAGTPVPELLIPRVERAPALEDFTAMAPGGGWEGRLARVAGFLQHVPTDGAPATEPTEVYLGYDRENLYVVFVAFDSGPAKIRARLARREDIQSDDVVEVLLDTLTQGWTQNWSSRTAWSWTSRATPTSVRWNRTSLR